MPTPTPRTFAPQVLQLLTTVAGRARTVPQQVDAEALRLRMLHTMQTCDCLACGHSVIHVTPLKAGWHARLGACARFAAPMDAHGELGPLICSGALDPVAAAASAGGWLTPHGAEGESQRPSQRSQE